MKKKVTIKEVAKQSGVSIATVSQILNGNADKFSPKTVEKVQATKDQLGYEPDYFARRMIMKKSKTIGVLVPDITNPFFSHVIRGIENILYQDDFVTMLCNADLDAKKEINYLEELTRRGVDGFIIASSAISNQAINQSLRQKNIPFIVLDQKKAEGFSDAVVTDDFSGGMQAGQHLKKLGHQNVAIVLPEEVPENILMRVEGFKTQYADPLLIPTEFSKKGGAAAVKAILNTEVSAIFAINDELAFGVYYGLNQVGKSIPKDYSVIGYDDIDMSQYVTPQLTTVAQPIFELGQTVAALLLERIKEPEKAWEEKQLPVTLVKRESTKALNSNNSAE